ncbi:MAG TPA: glycosyltransferase family 4 protein [Acidobacteriota bacterium]|nr:glycosyltransferase family 4 protein [Acidobacteriota bacterium]
MRVLIHHRTQGQGVEGVHLLGMARGFERAGCEVSILSPPGAAMGAAGEAPRGGSGLRRIWYLLAAHAPEFLFELAEIAYNVPAYFRLRRALREHRADVLYERYAFFNLAGAWAARSLGIPLVLEANYTSSTPLFRERSRLLAPLARAFERRVFRSARLVAAVSSYLRDRIVEAGLPADRVLLLPNAADPERFHPDPDGRAAVRKRLGLDGTKVVGFSGAFFPWHGVEMIVEVLPRVLARVPNAAVLLLGDGPQRAALVETARANGLLDRVHLAGWIGHDALPAHLAAFDVAVMPDSNEYGSPMKIFEYMAMGVPVVAPRLGPLQDGILDGETGRLVTPRDRAALGEALADLLADDALRARMGARAAEHVARNHTWERNASRVLATLQAGGSGRGGAD